MGREDALSKKKSTIPKLNVIFFIWATGTEMKRVFGDQLNGFGTSGMGWALQDAYLLYHIHVSLKSKQIKSVQNHRVHRMGQSPKTDIFVHISVNLQIKGNETISL